VRITSKGQITIPIAIREKAGLRPGTEVEFRYDGQVVTIVKVASPTKQSRGERLVALMRGKGDLTMCTDEIVALTRGD